MDRLLGEMCQLSARGSAKKHKIAANAHHQARLSTDDRRRGDEAAENQQQSTSPKTTHKHESPGEAVTRAQTVSYTHLTLPTNREV